MGSKYCKDIKITCYEADYYFNMRPAAFLDYAQEIAGEAAEELSFADEDLERLGCVWVLARMHTKFLRPVKYKERLKLYTWHRGLKGVNFVRDYQLRDAENKVVVNSTSSWVVMDFVNRRLSRDPELMKIIPAEAQDEDFAIETPCPKIVLPKDVSLLGSHKVVWSDVDHNHHANNVKYTVWCMDALPEEFVREHELLESYINFNKEVQPGETVDLYHAETDGAHIIEGRVGDAQVFITKLVFEG